MSQRISILVLTAGALIVALAYLLALAAGAAGSASASSASTVLTVTGMAPWLLASGATLVLTGLGLLGAGARAPRLAAVVLIACALTFAGFATALLLKPHAAGAELLLGLPRATTLMLLLTGLVPLVMLPLAYAALFKHEAIGDE